MLVQLVRVDEEFAVNIAARDRTQPALDLAQVRHRATVFLRDVRERAAKTFTASTEVGAGGHDVDLMSDISHASVKSLRSGYAASPGFSMALPSPSHASQAPRTHCGWLPVPSHAKHLLFGGSVSSLMSQRCARTPSSQAWRSPEFLLRALDRVNEAMTVGAL